MRAYTNDRLRPGRVQLLPALLKPVGIFSMGRIWVYVFSLFTCFAAASILLDSKDISLSDCSWR